MLGPVGLGALALILYVAAEAMSLVHLRSDRPAHGRATTALLALGFLVHFVALRASARVLHTVPYHDLADSMSFFAWNVAAIYGVLLLRHREGSTGPFLIPLSILFLGVSLAAHRAPTAALPRDPKLTGALFAFHVTLAILGYAALTLAFVLAQLYLIQNRQLRRRHLGLLFSRLPALDVLSRMHRTSVSIGVAALTLASSLGLVWAKRHWGSPWDPKVLFTFLVIGVYVLTLVPGRTGWGGKKNALVSLTGFGLLLFSYTIVNLFLSAEHLFR